MGAAPTGPRRLTADDIDMVLGCSDLAALADMRGYVRSYFASGGAVVMGIVGMAVGFITQRRGLSLAGVITAGGATINVLEARRRARQWESVIEVAIARLISTSQSTASRE